MILGGVSLSYNPKTFDPLFLSNSPKLSNNLRTKGLSYLEKA
jgi:hypothetical protein